MSKILVKKEWISKHFYDFFTIGRKKYNFFMGSRGSSKTTVILINLLLESFMKEYRNIYYCRHEWETIRRFTFKDICQILERTGLDQYFHYSKAENSSMVFKNKITGWTISPYGLSDLENIKGMPNPTDVFIDEVTSCHRETIGKVLAVLRTPMCKVKRLLVAWNPISEKHFMRSDYFDDFDWYKIKEVIKIGDFEINLRSESYFNHSTFFNNDFLNHEEYATNLLLQANGDESKIACDYYGRWGNIIFDNLFIFAFNEKKHVTDQIKYDTRYPLYISVDFNVNPMTATIHQTDLRFTFIHTIDEIRLENSNIYELCDEIKNRGYQSRNIFITGDAAGWARSVHSRGQKSSFDIIREELKLAPNQIKTPRGKPSGYVNEKRNLGNALMHRHPNLRISTKCPFLIEDLTSVQVDTTGHMDKSKDAKKSHLLDSILDFYYSICKDSIKLLK